MLKYLKQKSLPIAFNVIKFIDMMMITYSNFYEDIWMFLFDVSEIEILPGNRYDEYQPSVIEFLKGFSVRPSQIKRDSYTAVSLTRAVLMTEKHADTIEELENLVKILIQYTLLYSTERYEIDWESIEQSLRSEIVNIRSLIN